MPGKFDSRRDEMIYVMSLEGWATKTAGSVESPTGFFGYMENDGSELTAIRDAFPGFDDVPDKDLIGCFYFREDSQGFFTVTECDLRVARAGFLEACEEFDRWDEA